VTNSDIFRSFRLYFVTMSLWNQSFFLLVDISEIDAAVPFPHIWNTKVEQDTLATRTLQLHLLKKVNDTLQLNIKLFVRFSLQYGILLAYNILCFVVIYCNLQFFFSFIYTASRLMIFFTIVSHIKKIKQTVHTSTQFYTYPSCLLVI